MSIDAFNEEITNIQLQSKQIIDAFNLFINDCETLVNKAEDILMQDIIGDPVILQEDISKTLAYSYSAGSYIATAQKYLTRFELLYHCKKDTKLSETDRKLYVSNKTSNQKELLMLLKNIEDKLNRRMMACQSMLKYETYRMMKEQQ